MFEPTSADHGDVLYDIGRSEEVGRFMRAKKNLEPGEVIFTDQPAVVGPDSQSLPLCTVCWRSTRGSSEATFYFYISRKVSGDFICPDCRWPLCDANCQRTEVHQAECEVFKKRKSRVNISNFNIPHDIYDAILPLRVLLLKITNRR